MTVTKDGFNLSVADGDILKISAGKKCEVQITDKRTANATLVCSLAATDKLISKLKKVLKLVQFATAYLDLSSKENSKCR